MLEFLKLPVHVFAGGVFHCEDEPVEFEWNRLTELQRRNTLCPAHLKTSYPVETQRVKPQEFTDDALRYSLMPSGKKRKNEQPSDEDEMKPSLHLRSVKQVCTCQGGSLVCLVTKRSWVWALLLYAMATWNLKCLLGK
jgi:hypothetical protein